MGLDANIVKLLDFGIVRVLNPLEANSEDLTMGEWIGTPHFLAPENFLGDRADLRSDIYALGLVFYLLLTGKQPLASHDINRLISLRLKHPEPPPPSTLVPSVPKELDAIVLRCLQRDPNTRYQDAGELMSALTSVMNTHLGSSNAPRVVIRPEGVDQTDQRAAPEGEKSLGDTNTTQAPERAQNSDGRAGPMPSPDSPTMNDQPTKKDDKPLADLPTHILEDEEQDDTVIE
ncbi:MAG: protein kinase [Deltaproteobacteria bacterium]|nr:protein kinase [Deltaproteobacteria bacterium]